MSACLQNLAYLIITYSLEGNAFKSLETKEQRMWGKNEKETKKKNKTKNNNNKSINNQDGVRFPRKGQEAAA